MQPAKQPAKQPTNQPAKQQAVLTFHELQALTKATLDKRPVELIAETDAMEDAESGSPTNYNRRMRSKDANIWK